jgi:hypothetical protein
VAALRTIWALWLRFARVVGRANTFLVLTAIYFLVMPLFALQRLWDPLGLRPRRGRIGGGASTCWRERTPAEQSVERFTRRY